MPFEERLERKQSLRSLRDSLSSVLRINIETKVNYGIDPWETVNGEEDSGSRMIPNEEVQ